MISKNKFQIFILIASVLWLFSFSGFNNLKIFKSNSIQDKTLNDSTKVDSLQLLLNEYSAFLFSRDSIIHKIEADSLWLRNESKVLSELNNKIVTASKKCDEINDSSQIKKDSIYYAEIEKYNNKIENLLLEIVKVKNAVPDKEKSLKKSNSDKNIFKTSIEKKDARIKVYTSKIIGAESVIFKNVKYNLFVADLDSHEIRMHLINNKNGKRFYTLDAVKNFLESDGKQPLMITNAGMFTPEHNPEGLYIEEKSNTKFKLDTGNYIPDANFYLKPNGVFYIDSLNIPHIDTTEEYLRLEKAGRGNPKLATQSGPMLVINGRLHPSFTYASYNAKIRSGVGIINSKKVIFAITIYESNFYDFAAFFRDIFDCKNALFLDGAISKMYLKDINATSGGDFGPMISVSKKHTQ